MRLYPVLTGTETEKKKKAHKDEELGAVGGEPASDSDSTDAVSEDILNSPHHLPCPRGPRVQSHRSASTSTPLSSGTETGHKMWDTMTPHWGSRTVGGDGKL